MIKFKPYNNGQLMLLPPSLNEFVDESHLARLVDTVVEKLDTSLIEKKYSEKGQKTYHPKILLKLLFYGYAIGERSGRKTAKKCETDTAYMYLAQMYRPDFRTINDFRKNNIKEISNYFVDIVCLIKNLGMIKIGEIYIDGTKIKANAANRRTKTKEEYEKWEKKINEKIDKILREADELDEQEDEMYGDKRGDELPEDINTEEKLRKKINDVMEKFNKEKENRKKINITDSDASFVKDGQGRINVGYNCQIAVSPDQFIVSGEVNNVSSDRKELIKMIESSEKNIEENIKEIIADAGYSSYDNYEYLEQRKKIGYIPDQNFRKAKEEEKEKYHIDNFKYNETKDEYICPEKHILKLEKIRNSTKGVMKRNQKIYKCLSCNICMNKELCTKAKYRTIAVEARKNLLLEMRKRLKSQLGLEKYKKRMNLVESPFGHLKYNLGFKQFLLRGQKKVLAEFRLMCIGYNVKKLHLQITG